MPGAPQFKAELMCMRVCGWRPVCADCLALIQSGVQVTGLECLARLSSCQTFVRAGVGFGWLSQDIIAKTAVAGSLLLDVCVHAT